MKDRTRSGIPNTPQPESLIAKARQLRQEWTERITQKLLPGAKVEDIARAIGADESYISRSQNAVIFDVARFVQDNIARERPQELPMQVYSNESGEFVAPQGGINIQAGTGENPFEKRVLTDRSERLREVLFELEIAYAFAPGAHPSSPDRVRTRSHDAYILEALKKVILINDEEGEATFIVHRMADGKSWRDYARMQKSELESIPYVERLLDNTGRDGWKGRVKSAILADNYERPENSRSKEEVVKSEPPSGWLTHGDLVAAGVARKPFETFLGKLSQGEKDIHSGLFVRKRHGKAARHYSPELLEKFREAESALKHPPKGWLSDRGIAKVLGVDRADTMRELGALSAQFLSAHSGIYDSPNRKKGRYYSPAVLEEIKKSLAQRPEKAPSGWLTISGLQNLLSVGEDVVEEAIRELLEKSGNKKLEAQRYLDPIGHIRNHYDPAIIPLLREELAHHVAPPTGWLTESQIAEKLRSEGSPMSSERLLSIAQEMKLPESETAIRRYLSRGGVKDHYHPEIVTKFLDEQRKLEKAPPGWMTRWQIAHRLGISDKVVSKLITQVLKAKDGEEKKDQVYEWGYLDTKQRNKTHYSPEVVYAVEELWGKYPPAPSGWQTVGAMAKTFDVDHSTAQRLARRFIESRPTVERNGLVGEYRSDSNILLTHFSPDVARAVGEGAEKLKKK